MGTRHFLRALGLVGLVGVNGCNLLTGEEENEANISIRLMPASPVLFDYEIQFQVGISDDGSPVYKTVPPGWIRLAMEITNNSETVPVTIMAFRITEAATNTECVVKPDDASSPIAEIKAKATLAESDDACEENASEDADSDCDVLESHSNCTETSTDDDDNICEMNVKVLKNVFCGNFPITKNAQGEATSYSKSFQMKALGYEGTYAEPTGRLLKTISFSSQ